MNLTIFELKPIVSIDNDNIRDLTYPSMKYNYDPDVVGIVAVNEYLAMRPDLISRAGYGSTDMWDLMLKYNGISNPFSIDTDDIFLVPSLTDMKEQLAPDGRRSSIADSMRKQYIDVSKKGQADERVGLAELRRREAQREKVKLSGVQSISNLPPNIAEVGDREIVIKGGKVYFGPDISKGKQECENPLSKGEFIAKLIKNRLKNG